ncbi:biotin/lipoyl-binding protein [Candidatus Gracilibacteria bacterium]|nr:biotin/lipoyl-binding protein [Candidatus Gracilibacteria bacterium]
MALLTSCGEVPEDIQADKVDFFVETLSGKQAGETIILEKTGQVRSGQDISLSSNASGRVAEVYVKTGDSVNAGQVLAVLEDSIGSYGINLQRSGIGVERAKINYESTQLTLDKSVFDAEMNLDTLERNLIALKIDSQQNLLLAKDNLDNSQYGNLDSSSALKLESLDNSIEKSKLDYEIKVSSDEQSVEGYKATIKKEFSGLLTTLIDVQEFADSLLGITNTNKNDNDDFENFLGVQDKNQKRSSELSLQVLIDYREASKFEEMSILAKKQDITEPEMIEVIDYIDDGYDKVLDLLNKLEVTVNNSLQSVGNLDQTQITGFISSINGYQASTQGAYGAYISVGTNIKSFLNTYKSSQASILKSIELQEKDRDIQYKILTSGELSASTGYERTLISTQDNIADLESRVESAKKNLENAEKNRDITLRSLQNSISDAQVNYSSSAKEYGKLTIRSPINGTIGNVLLDQGQEISTGTPSFEIVSDSSPEVEISFSKGERDLLTENVEVEISVQGEVYVGNIYAVSEIADDNLNYRATIVFDSGVNIIGNLVNIKVPVNTGKMLLPLNILEIQGEGIALVKTLSGSTFADVRIRLGEVFGEYAEIISCAENCEDLNIITSDVSNYDENKFTIIEK